MWSYFLVFGVGVIVGIAGTITIVITILKKAMGFMKPKQPLQPGGGF